MDKRFINKIKSPYVAITLKFDNVIFYILKHGTYLKLGQNMELVLGIDRILGPLTLGRTSLYIEWEPGAREV